MQAPPDDVLEGWPKPNYVDPVTHGRSKIVLNVVLYAILLCIVALRMVTRIWLRKSFGGDDVLILLALVPTTAFFIISILADTRFLWTRHSWDIPPDQIPNGLKMVLATELMFAAACTLTKLSILLLTRRILKSASLVWRRITIFAITIVTLQGSIFCLTIIFQCRPISAGWTVTVGPNPNCVDSTASLLAAGIINTLTDFMVVMLPIRAVWNLKLPSLSAGSGNSKDAGRKSNKFETWLPAPRTIPVILLFGLGFISAFAGAARTYYTYQISNTWDKIWASYPVWVSAAVELYVGIICASIPATKPFFITYLPSVFTTTPASSTANNSRAAYINSYSLSRPRSLHADASNTFLALENDQPQSVVDEHEDIDETRVTKETDALGGVMVKREVSVEWGQSGELQSSVASGNYSNDDLSSGGLARAESGLGIKAFDAV